MAIDVKRIVEVNVEMTLNDQEASDLLYFLKNGLTPSRAPSITPYSNIVRDLAMALAHQGVK